MPKHLRVNHTLRCWSNHPWKAVTLGILLVTCSALAGCSDDARSCETYADCFSSELCLSGSCQTQAGSSDAAGQGGDAASSNDDAASSSDGSSSESDGSATGPTCTVDPFSAQCDDDDDPDDRNDSWSDAEYGTFKDTSLGCYGSLESPEAWDNTIEGRKCYDEDADYFSVMIVPCDSQYRFRVSLTVPPVCSESQYAMDFRIGGKSIECDESTPYETSYALVKCEKEANTVTRTILVKPSNSVWSTYYGVAGAGDDPVQFDYTLHGWVD